MAIDGIEGGGSELTRVENQEIVKQKKEFPEEGDKRVKDPGNFGALFENTSRNPKGLRERVGGDTVELNSKPPETGNAPGIANDQFGPNNIEPNQVDAQSARNRNQTERSTGQPEGGGLSQVNAGATRNRVEVNSQENVFDQAAARNAVREREREFEAEIQRVRETNERQAAAEARASEDRDQIRVNANTNENVQQRSNLIDEIRQQSAEEGERNVREEVNNSEDGSNDVSRNLDLLA